jgi:D-alanyl-D-alanine carboxypeptidase
MSARALRWIPAGLLLLAACAPPPAGGGGEPALSRQIDALAEGWRATRSVPALSVVVAHRGRVLHARGYGTADREAGSAAGPETVYQLGSISKTFTAAAVLHLAERGLLSLDDPLGRHLPEVPSAWAEVRLHQLLGHTAGLPEFVLLPEFDALSADPEARADALVALLADRPLVSPPGERWAYSNTHYTLLALVIERAARQPYERVLAEAFFRPLGLRSMHACQPEPSAPSHARGYGLRVGEVVPAPPENMHLARGDGGLCGSVVDLARWMHALSRGRAVSPSSYARMTSAEPVREGPGPAYGLGLSLLPLDGAHPKVAHHGAMTGFTGMAAHYPEADLTVVVLANRGGLWADALEKAVARLVLGLPAPPSEAVPASPAMLSAVAGTYDVGPLALRVREQDGQLWLEAPPPAPTMLLRHLGAGVWVGEEEPDGIRLTFEGEAEAVRLRYEMAGMVWYGRRVE